MAPEKIRKRGKKHSRRKPEEEQEAKFETPAAVEETQAQVVALPTQAEQFGGQPEEEGSQPDWVRSAKAEREAPFGYVDVDVKAYFREIYEKMKEMEAHGYRARNTFSASSGEDDELSLMIKATLSEVDGKELSLATDPDTSFILEGLIQRVEGKALRVLVDRMAGEYTTLSQHRFGSHVVQTCLAALQPVISAENLRDAKGKARSSAIVSEQGTLRSATQLFYAFCEEITPAVPELIKDQFGSHVLRTTLLMLNGQKVEEDRSKKSARFRDRAKQDDPVQRPSEDMQVVIPSGFATLLAAVRKAGLEGMTAYDVRQLAIDPVASPLLQLLLRIEAESIDQDWTGTLCDMVLDGLVASPSAPETRSDHLESCLRDNIASHVLEVALGLCPTEAVLRFHALYIRARLAQLATHPSANFVVARTIRRLEGDALLEAVEEAGKVGDAFVKQSMLGVLQAVLERCGATGEHLAEAVAAVRKAFRLKGEDEEENKRLLVPVVLSLRTKKAFLHAKREERKRKRGEGKVKPPTKKEKEEEGTAWLQDEEATVPEYLATVQGSLLLQTMLRLPAPHNASMHESLLALETVMPFVRSATGVHVLLTALAAESTTHAQRRALIGALVPKMPALADDKWGSRLADAAWYRADGFTKERIAALMLKEERRMLASYYGAFFLRKLNLALYRKGGKSSEWKATVVPAAEHLALLPPLGTPETAPARTVVKDTETKRADKVDMELDGILAAL